MQYLGIDYGTPRLPELDAAFAPMGAWMRAYEGESRAPGKDRHRDGKRENRDPRNRADCRRRAQTADYRYLERLVKFLLWSVGGFRVTICGAGALAAHLARDYAPGGARAFDAGFMDDVFEQGLAIVSCAEAAFPAACGGRCPSAGTPRAAASALTRAEATKVSAVVDGEAIYSEEVVWHPKTQTNPRYHYEEIVKAVQTAASKMPRVDAIGVFSVRRRVRRQQSDGILALHQGAAQ